MLAEASPEVVKKVLFTGLDALRDYLSDIVVVGGWVPQIYAWTEKSSEIAVHSNDVDAAVAPKLPVRGAKGVVAAMEGADFSVEPSDTGFALATFGKKKKPSTRFLDADLRDRLHSVIFEIAMSLGAENADQMKRRTREQRHRKTVRLALQRLKLYEEWDTATRPSETETVNRSELADVSF